MKELIKLASIIILIIAIGCTIIFSDDEYQEMTEYVLQVDCANPIGQVIGDHFETFDKGNNVVWSEFTSKTCSFKFLHDKDSIYNQVVFTDNSSEKIGNAFYILDTSYQVSTKIFYQYKQIRETYKGILNNHGVCDFDNSNPKYDLIMRFHDCEGIADTLYIKSYESTNYN